MDRSSIFGRLFAAVRLYSSQSSLLSNHPSGSLQVRAVAAPQAPTPQAQERELSRSRFEEVGITMRALRRTSADGAISYAVEVFSDWPRPNVRGRAAVRASGGSALARRDGARLLIASSCCHALRVLPFRPCCTGRRTTGSCRRRWVERVAAWCRCHSSAQGHKAVSRLCGCALPCPALLEKLVRRPHAGVLARGELSGG